MSHPAEIPPTPDIEPEPIEQPDYSTINTWALKIVSATYNIPTLVQDVTPWLDPRGQLTDKAREMLRSMQVEIEKQQVNVSDLFDSVVNRGNEILEQKRKRAHSTGRAFLQFITGRFPQE